MGLSWVFQVFSYNLVFLNLSVGICPWMNSAETAYSFVLRTKGAIEFNLPDSSRCKLHLCTQLSATICDDDIQPMTSSGHIKAQLPYSYSLFSGTLNWGCSSAALCDRSLTSGQRSPPSVSCTGHRQTYFLHGSDKKGLLETKLKLQLESYLAPAATTQSLLANCTSKQKQQSKLALTLQGQQRSVLFPPTCSLGAVQLRPLSQLEPQFFSAWLIKWICKLTKQHTRGPLSLIVLLELDMAPPLSLASNYSQWPLVVLQQKIPLQPKKHFPHRPPL